MMNADLHQHDVDRFVSSTKHLLNYCHDFSMNYTIKYSLEDMSNCFKEYKQKFVDHMRKFQEWSYQVYRLEVNFSEINVNLLNITMKVMQLFSDAQGGNYVLACESLDLEDEIDEIQNCLQEIENRNY